MGQRTLSADPHADTTKPQTKGTSTAMSIEQNERSTADVLALAAEVVESRGWSHGKIIDEAGRVCAVGALYIASGHEPLYSFDADVYGEAFMPGPFRTAIEALAVVVPNVDAALGVEYGPVSRVFRWNDTCSRDGASTAQTLAATLRAAADVFTASEPTPERVP